MCNGPIIAPADKSKDTAETNFSLMEFLKRFWNTITCATIDFNQSTVNMCLSCGDLEIEEEWLNIPHPSKPRIAEAIKSGSIIINGRLTVCHFCRAVEVEKRRKECVRESSDFQLDFVHPTSTMSF